MVTEIVVGVAVAITAIISLVMCVCGKDKNARPPNSSNLDRAEDNNNDKREEEVAVRERSDNPGRDAFDPNRTESVRPKTLTINRKLPEIPHSATISAVELTTDLYATVDEATMHNTPALNTSSALNSPVPSTSSLQTSIHHHHHQNGTESLNRNRPPSIMSDRPAPIFEQRHNYAKIKGQTSEDRDTDTDTYCDPQVYAEAAGDGAARSFEPSSSLYEAPPPPVPEKYFELSVEANGSTQSSSMSSSAASAIAGNPSIADIPFMTSPVPSNHNLNFAEDASETYTRSDNVLQEIRYTSISVREPLANIRAQMIKPTSMISGPPPPPPPSSSSSASAAVVVESHYSIVPEEVDQTYAEIESAQHSATSSMTYSRIDADGERILMVPNAAGGYYPPAPPTVESLRTVAQAHSRHASSSSCISESSHHNSPASTDRSFELTDGATATGEGRSSSASPDFSAIYSVVDKSAKKYNRSTVHVMEVDQSTTSDKNGNHHHQKHPNTVSSIEDMYAKVTKKQRHVVHDVSKGARPKRPNTMDVNHVLKAHEQVNKPLPASVAVRRQSSGRDDYFGYEKIRDVGEQPELQEGQSDVFDGVEIRNKYITKKQKNVNDLMADVYDPNYEVVKSPKKNKNNEPDAAVMSYPNYEVIKESSYSFEDDQESENGYEKVKNRGPAFSRSDPNYESVRSYGGNAPNADVRIEAARETDQSGEAAGASLCWSVDALYEKIDDGHRDPDDGDDQSDPNYENVKTVSESSNETSEFGYESVPPKRKLFEVEDGYERIRDRGVVAVVASRKPAVEPGYASIKDRANDAPSVDDDDDDELYAVPSEPVRRNTDAHK